MFNDYNEATMPDKLSEYVNGFSLMSDEQISVFISDNALSFSKEQLIYIRDYFRNVKKMFPTYNQLLFFDAINRIRQSEKKDYLIYSATSNGGAEPILETSRDLLAKRSVIKRSVLGAMPLSFASEIASEYLTHIGYSPNEPLFAPANGTDNAQYYIHTDDGTPIFTYNNDGAKQSDSSSNHNTLTILCPAIDIDYSVYCDMVAQFTKRNEIAPITSGFEKISAPYGIFKILMKESNGVFVNLSNIPEIEKNEDGKITDLRAMLNSCYGRYVFSTPNTSFGTIKSIAEEYSLNAYIFAVKNNSLSITLENTKSPTFSFDVSFIQSIANFKEHREYTFSDEANAPLGAKKSIYITKNEFGASELLGQQNQTYDAEKILNFGKTIASANARTLDDSPHKTTALSIIDAINALVAKGVAKDSISLSIRYSLLSGRDDSIELGKNLAAILGAYRSMMELCVADNAPQISYNEKSREIAVIASAKTPIRQLKGSFASDSTKILFYEIKYREDGLPDYSKYREFLKYFYHLIEKDSISSAFAINENLTEILKSASQNTVIDFNEAFSLDNLKEAHGILFEVKNKELIPDIFYHIGDTGKKY